MSDSIYCPECGAFVETVVSGDEEILDLDCPCCGAYFEYTPYPEDEE